MRMAVPRDGGNTHVLESMILAFLLLGAAYTVATLGGNARDTARPRAQLDNLAHDALTVLAGTRDANGTTLDTAITEALHCQRDATPDTTSCDGRRGQNLSLRVQYSLPTVAGYAIMLSNGMKASDVYRSLQPPGEAVAQRIDFVAHVAGVADNAARPFQHALALRRETLEARAAPHQQHAHLLLDLLHPGRQSRLGHAAGLGSAAEVFFTGQSQQEFELVDHGICFWVNYLGQFISFYWSKNRP